MNFVSKITIKKMNKIGKYKIRQFEDGVILHNLVIRGNDLFSCGLLNNLFDF